MYSELGYEEETLDPRIQGELEKLNITSVEINTLEASLDKARSKYHKIFNEVSQQLKTLGKQLPNSIEKAKPYYESRMKARLMQAETQKAAQRYERACSQLETAKEMVVLAEEGFFNKKDQKFDPAWQEVLNEATTKVNDLENERLESSLEHERLTAVNKNLEREIKEQQKVLKKHITKSKAYYELLSKFNELLEEQTSRVSSLESQVKQQKQVYNQTLRNLERISESIHKHRKEERQRRGLGERQAGVGSESPMRYSDPEQKADESCEAKMVHAHHEKAELRTRSKSLHYERAWCRHADIFISRYSEGKVLADCSKECQDLQRRSTVVEQHSCDETGFAHNVSDRHTLSLDLSRSQSHNTEVDELHRLPPSFMQQLPPQLERSASCEILIRDSEPCNVPNQALARPSSFASYKAYDSDSGSGSCQMLNDTQVAFLGLRFDYSDIDGASSSTASDNEVYGTSSRKALNNDVFSTCIPRKKGSLEKEDDFMVRRYNHDIVQGFEKSENIQYIKQDYSEKSIDASHDKQLTSGSPDTPRCISANHTECKTNESTKGTAKRKELNKQPQKVESGSKKTSVGQGVILECPRV